LIKQSKLNNIYDFEVKKEEHTFNFRLEIHCIEKGFKGIIFRLERYRIVPSFHQDIDDELICKDDALFYIKDEFIDDQDLVGDTEEQIILDFIKKLETIFQINL